MSRELDAQVAEAMGIMGWRQTARNDGVEPADGKTYPFLCNDILFTEPNQPGQRWSPSTDIAAAVAGPLDALYDMNCWIKISNQIPIELGKKWRVEWVQVHPDRWMDYVWADTLPEAICLAFLRAMGREVNR